MTDADPEQFRTTMAHLAAGVSVVTIRDRHDLAFTANSVVSVSLEPPTVLFCVHEDSRIREALETASRWAVSIMGADGLGAADWLASPGRPTRGQLDRVPHRRGAHSGAAILDAASAWVECETDWIRTAGSHAVVVGRVLESGTHPRHAGAIVHRLGRMVALP
ncbi:flavin reductase family protein [Ruania halotolerans]|uniref:flavin reductase family protein n=1 Tax=Ruania halotolerans TaxID=2897773 RepID=UPI001E51C4EB|nr:flavin reductase family protein [Ruania halotolerans]UFU07494.1 flavin reductase family protein [Ruania halotolerans]